MYIIRKLHKYVEEDSYQDGCIVGTASSFTIDVEFTAETVNELIEKVSYFLDIDTKEGCEKCTCGESDRVDWSKLEDVNGLTANKQQFELWKIGKIKLWDANYVGRVEQVLPVNLEDYE